MVVFLLTIALGLAGLLATVSRTAAIAAALLTVGTLAHGVRLWLPDAGSHVYSYVITFGQLIVALSVVSLAGAALRFLAWRRADKSQLSGQP